MNRRKNQQVVCLDEVEELKLGISRNELEREVVMESGIFETELMAAFVVVGNDTRARA